MGNITFLHNSRAIVLPFCALRHNHFIYNRDLTIFIVFFFSDETMGV